MNLPLPFRIFNGIAVALFAAFAFFQCNDIPQDGDKIGNQHSTYYEPSVLDDEDGDKTGNEHSTYYKPSVLDAALWAGFYAFVAVLFALSLSGRIIPRWVLLAGALACFVQMGRTDWGLWDNLFGEKEFTMMGTSMTSADPRVELSREFFGALIALLGVVVLWWQGRKFAATAATSQTGSGGEADKS